MLPSLNVTIGSNNTLSRSLAREGDQVVIRIDSNERLLEHVIRESSSVAGINRTRLAIERTAQGERGSETWEISYIVLRTDMAGVVEFAVHGSDLAGNLVAVTGANVGNVTVGERLSGTLVSSDARTPYACLCNSLICLFCCVSVFEFVFSDLAD